MKNHKLLAITRIGFAILAMAAIVTQLLSSITLGRNLGNFFSFFTIESNILAIIMLLSLGISYFIPSQQRERAVARGAVTLYMTMTGIIYILLLSGNEMSLQTTIPWVNMVLHYILPVFVLVDWLLFPPKRRLTLTGEAWLWLLFPISYLIYSIIRGELTGWYPYPFINPLENGWPTVIVTSIIIAAAAKALAWMLALRTRIALKT
jgi:hypothetical protein